MPYSLVTRFDNFATGLIYSDRSVGFMKKGKVTREMILERAAALFNCRGYAGASMSDIMEVTGLEKGGIYNHFESKEMLAAEAFDYAVRQSAAFVTSALDKHESPTERLIAFIDIFSQLVKSPAVPGGCPLLNTAIEADDSNPLLRERVQKAMSRMRAMVEKLVSSGIASGELPADTEPENLALLIVSSLEGSLMMGRLYGDPDFVKPVQRHLIKHIEQLRKNRRGAQK